MSDIAVRVHNLGKRYVIGGKQEKYATLRDTIVDVAAAPFRRVRGVLRGESAAGLKEEIWALKDVSFEVKHGEVVGIIGRNGAGKSTLLKILSRITEPTTGYADVYGRIGALLEVGTGFHPELTGRENIFLNGAILGMSREEIRRKFDEIVDFAGVEKFIDTPVKHYSSGMGLRLGFAVAAHLEPEILIVDEVLAVGDAEFQKKSMGKMSEVAGEGRTVLFVSHNMAAVEQLCDRSVLLDSGSIVIDSETTETLQFYVSRRQDKSNRLSRTSVSNTSDTTIETVAIFGVGSNEAVHTGLPFRITVQCILGHIPPTKASLGFTVEDVMGSTVFACHSNQYGVSPESNRVEFTASIDRLPLVPGFYGLSVYLSDSKQDHVVLRNMLEFEVLWNPATYVAYPPRKGWGHIFVPVDWSIRKLNDGNGINIVSD